MRNKILLKAIDRMIHSISTLRNWFLPRTQYNYKCDVGDGFGSSTVMAPILWIARTFPEAPIALKINNEIEHDHAMIELLKKPNDFYSGIALLMAALISFNTNGNAYWLKIRNTQLKVIQLWYIPHWMIEPRWNVEGTEFINHYDYIPDGKRIRIENSDIVHFRNGLDPHNTRLGLSPLGSLFREIFTDDEAANFTAALLKNTGVPGLVISPAGEEQVLKEDVRATKSWFKKKFFGDKRGEPLVMRGATNIKQFTFSPLEMDLGKLRQIPEERVAAILGIPAAVVGFGAGLQQTKVGATMKELREMAYESCIIPMQRLIAIEIENQLLIDFETKKDIKVIFDLTNVRVLQEDQNKLAVRVGKLVDAGLIEVAEARTELGYEVKPEHHIYLRKVNVMAIPVGQINYIEDEKNKRLKLIISNNIKAEEWQQALILQFQKDCIYLGEIFQRELYKQFEKIGKHVADAWEKIAEEREIDFSKSVKALEDDVYTQLVMEILAFDKLNYEMQVIFQTHFLRVAKQTFDTINTTIGLGINLTDPIENITIQESGKRLGLIDLNKQTKESLFDAISEGRKLGEGPDVLARRIRDTIPKGKWSSSKIRSEVIARTETKYAQNKSSIDAYRQSEYIEMVEIFDGQIATSCQPCIDRNGDIVTFDEANDISISEHPNGTLSFSPVMRS